MLDELVQDRAEPPSFSGQGPGKQLRRFPLEFLPGMTVSREPNYLFKGLLPAGGLVVLYGRPGSGKSFVALDLALHLAAGRPWAGCKTQRRRGVVFVASEAGRGMRKRIVAAVNHHGMDLSIQFALVTVAPDLGQRDKDGGVLAREIRDQLPQGFDIGLVVLDTLARSMVGADESGSAGMSLFIENAEQLGETLGATVLAIHHMGKDIARGMRGSSALLGAVEAAWEIDPEEGGLMRVVKMKEDEGGRAIPFTLEPVTLDTDRDGDPITTLVVRTGDLSAEAPNADEEPADVRHDERESASGPAALSMSGSMFLTALERLIEQHGAEVRRFKHIPRGARVVTQRDLVRHAEALGVRGVDAKSSRSTIDRHIRDLVGRGLIQRHRGHLWLSEPVGNHDRK